ncbi:protein kinase domain-containing protein [Labrys okinawensis]|uniref:protein kinase domain-containing protein n=1 Tax=Labrys okinawensis TaxID=346911 RepID=UPI0039BD9180
MDDDRTRIAMRGSAVSIGTELNQTYRIDSLLGVGGMGEVFKGHNIQTGDPVAIKIVLPEFAQDETILGLFRKEARILNHLYHDAIVRYYVFSIDPAISRPYLAMEFVDGPSLAAHVKNAPLPASEFMPLLRRLADGLHRAHAAGVIHRDMSPDNVILPGGLVQNAKIIDFGIARSANVGGETLLGGSFAGKYNFVSPEQLGLYGGEVTPKSDIYSLALVMAAAMRGRPLEMSGTQVDIIEKRRTVPDLSGIPKQFHPVLSAMLTPEPAKRPADMAAIRDWPDDQPSSKSKAEKPKAAVSNAAQAKPPKPSNALRNSIFAIAMLAVIGIGALGGWIYTHGNMFSNETPIAKQPDNKPPDDNNQDKAALQAARHDRLAGQLSAAGQDSAALQSFLDQCGADCPDDLAKQAQQRINTAKEQAARRDRLAGQLAAAGQDRSALQNFLDQCGADCPDDLAKQAQQRINTVKEQAARHDRLAAQLSAAGQDSAALQSFLDQCGANCPDDLAKQAQQRINTLKEQAARHDRLAAQLAAAGQDIAALRSFLDQCGADCPSDLGRQAQEQINALKGRATRRDRLAAQLSVAGQDMTALQNFLDQCGANCPADLAQQAQTRINGLKEQAARHDRLAAQLSAAGQDSSALQRFLDQCGADCPGDLSQRAQAQINGQKEQATRRDSLTAQLSGAGQNMAALQSFLDQCGADCPDDLAKQARQRIDTLKLQTARHDSLVAQLSGAGQNMAALQGFLDQCGADCPDDIAKQAQQQIATLKQQAARHDRLAAQLTVAGSNVAALRRFVDQCGADCPDDLLTKAKAVIDKAKPPIVASLSPAVLQDFVTGFGANSCFAATADNVTATSATITALGTSASGQNFIDAFKQKAGFTPDVTLDPVADPQCGFVSALKRMSVPGGPPLNLALSKSEIRGSDADTGKTGDPLTVSVTGAGERNIYLFVMDHQGGIQNINRLCASCITMKTGEMEAGLSLTSPAKVDGESRPPFYPMLVFAVASSRPLISINSQDAFTADDFIAPFLTEIANTKDVTTAVGFVKLRDQ